MKIFRTFVSLVILSLSAAAFAQTGPGGVGDTLGNSALQLWLRSDAGLSGASDMDPVNVWQDQSGADNDVYSGGSFRPVYRTDQQNNLPAIWFNGGQYLQGNNNASFHDTTITLFIVTKGYTGGAVVAVSDSTASWNNEFMYFNDQAYMHRSSGNFISNRHQCSDSIPDDSCRLITMRFNASVKRVEHFVNGTVSTNPDMYAGTLIPFLQINRVVTLGQRNAFRTSEYMYGSVLEVIGYNEALSDGQIDSVEGYLKNKYQINYESCQEVLAVSEFTENAVSDLIVFPNPATGEITLSVQDLDPGLAGYVIIYATTGSNVMEKEMDLSVPQTIGLGCLNPGFYLLEVTVEGRVMRRKVLIQ